MALVGSRAYESFQYQGVCPAGIPAGHLLLNMRLTRSLLFATAYSIVADASIRERSTSRIYGKRVVEAPPTRGHDTGESQRSIAIIEARSVAVEDLVPELQAPHIQRRNDLDLPTGPDGSPKYNSRYWDIYWQLHPEEVPSKGSNFDECYRNYKSFVRHDPTYSSACFHLPVLSLTRNPKSRFNSRETTVVIGTNIFEQNVEHYTVYQRTPPRASRLFRTEEKPRSWKE